MNKYQNNILKNITFKLGSFDNNDFSGNFENEDFTIRAFYEEDQIAYLKCYHESGRLYSFEVHVNSEYRRKGIATKMYDYAQELSGKTIYPHHENPYNNDPDGVSDEALLFWRSRRQ